MTADNPDITRLVDPASRFDPYPMLAQFRAASPYVVSDGLLVAAGTPTAPRCCVIRG
ncbi:hypothetical protein [Streptomyces sp. AC550_RSS872]|uniref:hypothetical protein n=1 Tax=Streptomyces sp. AC550_RSS872 TaxID=2823689 RepID=UPI001C26A054|nr:hypothetical protein [Streptomyces sp. AC550_RSS872]